MAGPSTAITRFDLSLSYNEFSLMANRRKFIGLKVLPPLGVSQEGPTDFLRLNVESFMTAPQDTRRAPYGGYNRGGWNWTKDSYVVEEHGVEEIADDATIERYGDIVRVEQISVARAVERVLSRLEHEIAAAVMNTSTWTGAALTSSIDTINGSVTSGDKWTDKNSSDPIADIDWAREKVKANCGMAPNAVVMTDTDFINCMRTDRIEGLLKYDAMELLLSIQGGRNVEIVSSAAQALAGLFQVDRVLVGQAFKNTGGDGDAPTFGRYWTAGRVMVAHIHDDGMSGDLEAAMPNIGRTIFSTKNGEPLPGSDDAGFGSLIFDEYREEQVRGSVFRPRNKRGIKILHVKAGHLLTDAQ